MRWLFLLFLPSLVFAGSLTFLNNGTGSAIAQQGGFNYRSEISVSSGAVTDLTGYPVMVTLNSSSFTFSHAQRDGRDIRFYDDVNKTNLLDHWIEEWDYDNETATIWVEPNAHLETIQMFYGDRSLSDVSNGSNVFTYFSGFENSITRNFPWGADDAVNAVFDPVSRRFYRFNIDDGNGNYFVAAQWVNIDTGEVGYIFQMPNKLTGGFAAYHPVLKKIYIYGGRSAVDTFSNAIVEFDPATETFTVLTETLNVAAQHTVPVYNSNDEKIYLFGGHIDRLPSSVFTDMIQVHDPVAETCIDTGANLRSASAGHGAIYSNEKKRIYLFGGQISDGAGGLDSTDTIDIYDPATPAADPIDSGETLETPNDTMAISVYRTGANRDIVYLFGGYNFTAEEYTDRIEKFVVETSSRTTLSETSYMPDDDMGAFFDAPTNKIYSGPWIHSSGSENENARKVVILEFDPVTETFAVEPSTGLTPSGWSSAGTSTLEKPKAIGGSYMVLADLETTKFVRAEESILSVTDKKFIEIKVSVPNGDDNYQFNVFQSASSLNAFKLHNFQSDDWYLHTGTNPGTLITSIPNGGYHIIGALIDVSTEEVYGEVNRANRTTAQGWHNTGITINKLWFNTSTGSRGAFSVDWVLFREGTTGTQPTSQIESETVLRSLDNVVLQ